MRVALRGAAVAAGIGLGFFLIVGWRQLTFPLQLESLEETILLHAERLASGAWTYPPPSADFVALAYNPGLYLLLWPALKVFHPSLFLLRLPGGLASLALAGIFGYLLFRRTGSRCWFLIGAVVPVVAMRSFDCNLMTGHADTIVVALALSGAFLLQGRRLPLPGSDRDLLAAAVLICAFWFKQNAAVIAAGVGLYFLLRNWRSAWRPLGVLLMFGPVAYLLAGPRLLGPDFLNATSRVPASWSRWDLEVPLRFLGFLLFWWAVPLGVAVWVWLRSARTGQLLREPVVFLLPFALATGLIGALDPGSSDNVFSLAGAWLLVVFLQEIGPALRSGAPGRARRAGVVGLAMAGAMLTHDIRDWNTPEGAEAAYADFLGTIRQLDAPIYLPWIGALDDSIPLTARAHWVALEDRCRGPNQCAPSDPFVRAMLAPVADAPAPAYVLTSSRLEDDHLLSWLTAGYALRCDFGQRWRALQELPHRFGARYPRFLYGKRAIQVIRLGHPTPPRVDVPLESP